MKRIVAFASVVALFFATAACLLIAPAKQTVAETEIWLRITQQDAWFCKNASSAQADRMFLLAYSYYVRAISQTENGFYAVELMENSNGFVKLFGYVNASAVTVQNETPLAPIYPVKVLSVNNSDTVLFSAPSSSATSVCGAFVGQNVYYYGTFPSNGENWYFVRYGQSLCYVAADAVTAPNINLHPTPLPSQVPTVAEPETPPEQQEEHLAELQIALIVLICVPSVIVTTILFLPTKSKKQNYIDASDSEAKQSSSHKSAKNRPRYFDDYL